jgi:hypothetical protein
VQAIQQYRWLHNSHFAVAHALEFSVSTSRLLATDLNTETSTDIYYSLTVTALFLWVAESNKRTGLSFVYAAGLASVVFLGSESPGIRDHILLYQIWDFLFVASYDSRGHGGGIRLRLHTGEWIHFSYKHFAQTPRKAVCIVDDVTALHSTFRYAEMCYTVVAYKPIE